MALGKLNRGSGNQGEHLQAIPLSWAKTYIGGEVFSLATAESDTIALVKTAEITLKRLNKTQDDLAEEVTITIPIGSVLALQAEVFYSFTEDTQVILL